MRFAMLFPGQGSQAVGMLKEHAERSPLIRQTFQQAGKVLDIDLWKMVRDGPAEELNRTENTQPAMLAAGVALWRLWQEAGGPNPRWMAGHSLGEYTALVCAGVLEFTDAVRLVAWRGEYMQAAVAEGEGAMAAIIGLGDEQLKGLCQDVAGDEVLEAVNFNAPGQVVIAGHKAAVERGAEAAKAKGAKLTKILPVSVPSHCALMRPAAERLEHDLELVPKRKPKIPVLQNIDGMARDDVDSIRKALIMQLYSPVRWVDTIKNMQTKGAKVFLECGPGAVLSGLVKRIDRKAQHIPLSQPAQFDEALKLCAKD